MIKQMGTESIRIWTEHATKDNGKKINSMERVKKLGQMEHCMKVIM